MIYSLLVPILILTDSIDTSFTLKGFSPTDMHTAYFEGKLYLEITDQQLGLPAWGTNYNTINRLNNFDTQQKEINLTVDFYYAKFFFTESIDTSKKIIEFPPQYTIDLSNITNVFLSPASLDLTINNAETVYVINFYYSDIQVVRKLYECFKRLQPTYKFKFEVDKYLIRKKIIH